LLGTCSEPGIMLWHLHILSHVSVTGPHGKDAIIRLILLLDVRGLDSLMKNVLKIKV
jgi:hypothetical protein